MTARQLELVNIYKKSQTNLYDTITKKVAKGAPASFQRAMLREVNQELAVLQNKSLKWVESQIPLQYTESLAQADKNLQDWFDYADANNIQRYKQSFKSMTAINRKAIDALINTTAGNISVANSGLKKSIQGVLTQKIASGETIKQTKDRIVEEIYGSNGDGKINIKGRKYDPTKYAETVARSSTAEATNTAAESEAKAVGSEVIEMSSHFPTCPICSPLQGRWYSLSPDNKDYPYIYDTAWKSGHKTVHPNCILGDTVIGADEIVSHSARSYEGEIVVITTSAGEKLSVTPNHPILTNRGWVDAGKLTKLDKVVKYIGSQGVSDIVNPDDIKAPTMIKEIPDALWKSGEMSTRRMPVSTEDFHGDGANSEVCIIRSNRFLLNKPDISGSQHICEHGFHIGDAKLSRLNSDGFSAKSLKSNLRTSVGFVSGSGFILSLFCGHSLIHSSASFASVKSGHDSCLFKPRTDGHFSNPVFKRDMFLRHSIIVKTKNFINRQVNALLGFIPFKSWSQRRKANAALFSSQPDNIYTDTEDCTDLFNSLSGNIKFLDIVDIENDFFTGHVYNLQTKSNWYVANNIITHNCEHRFNAVVLELEDSETIAAKTKFSNRPIENPGQTQKQLDRYYKDQDKKAKKWSDFQQYERYKSRLGEDNVPKSFSGFRSMKKSGNDNWQQMTSSYKAAGRPIGYQTPVEIIKEGENYERLLNFGAKIKDKGWLKSELEYAYDIDKYSYEDSKIIRLGFDGTTELKYVKGWRYGEFTDGGVSINHQSGVTEKGLSMMEVTDMKGKSIEKGSKASALFLQDKGKFYAEGWYTPDIWGSDGEPLLINPRHPTKRKKLKKG